MEAPRKAEDSGLRPRPFSASQFLRPYGQSLDFFPPMGAALNLHPLGVLKALVRRRESNGSPLPPNETLAP
jgi:hypothetical protein